MVCCDGKYFSISGRNLAGFRDLVFAGVSDPGTRGVVDIVRRLWPNR